MYMRAVFMGTPDFSVPVLRAMLEDQIEVVGVVTQPDRPKGRGKGLSVSPVKEEALRHKIPVFQPVKIREPEAIQTLAAWEPEVIVVVAFGQILTKEVLEIPPMGCINVHASLLPAYRGAAPIQYAVLDGLSRTGVTTMRMDEGLDTGDILLQKSIPLEAKETGGSLFDKLSVIGAELLIETLHRLDEGNITPVPQSGESQYVGMIRKSMGQIDWSMPAVRIERQIRAMNPWPSAYTYREGKMLKIWDADIAESQKDMTAVAAVPGTVCSVEKDAVYIQTGEGSLILREVQPEGKKRMDIGAYLRGYPLQPGMVFSNSR